MERKQCILPWNWKAHPVASWGLPKGPEERTKKALEPAGKEVLLVPELAVSSDGGMTGVGLGFL